VKIYPSLISSDLLNLEKSIKSLDDHCDGYHLDVMDGHFVPNLTWGPAFIKRIIATTKLPVDVHLMVENPYWWVDKFELRENDEFVFHYESLVDKDKILLLIELLKKKNWKIGIAINPKTDIEKIIPFLPLLDQVLLMSVEPGFSGQKFISSVAQKVTELMKIKKSKNYIFKICMDGGIGKDNIKMISDLGVEQCGVASSIFGEGNPVENLRNLYNLVK